MSNYIFCFFSSQMCETFVLRVHGCGEGSHFFLEGNLYKKKFVFELQMCAQKRHRNTSQSYLFPAFTLILELTLFPSANSIFPFCYPFPASCGMLHDSCDSKSPDLENPWLGVDIPVIRGPRLFSTFTFSNWLETQMKTEHSFSVET